MYEAPHFIIDSLRCWGGWEGLTHTHTHTYYLTVCVCDLPSHPQHRNKSVMKCGASLSDHALERSKTLPLSEII